MRLSGSVWSTLSDQLDCYAHRSSSVHVAMDEIWNYGYGYAWWLVGFHRQSVRTFSGAGLGGQQIYVFPDLNAVVVLTGGSYWIPPVTRPENIMEQYIVPALR